MPVDTMDLTGKLLVAMPALDASIFTRSVIYMTEYSEKGAMGLIVNKPAEGVSLSDVLAQVSSEDTSQAMADLQLHIGGPVETERGFVLHSDEYTSIMQTLKVEGGFAVTATLDILEDIAAGKGPVQAMLMLGYAGWGPEQLDAEIARNGWLICDADPALVFTMPNAKKWSGALSKMGIDPLTLSAAAGRA